MAAREEFDDYVAARWPVLVRSAVFLGCSHADAEDLVQTTLMRCYRSWGNVASARDRDAYVYRVMLNCLSSSRSRRWWAEDPSTGHLPEPESSGDHAEAVTTGLLLRGALQHLSTDQRAVLVLRFYVDLSEQQVAEVLGVAVGTVKSRSSRALAELQRSLNPSASVTDQGGSHE